MKNNHPYLPNANELLSGEARLPEQPSDGLWGDMGVEMSSQLREGEIPSTYCHVTQINLYHKQQTEKHIHELSSFAAPSLSRPYRPFQNRRISRRKSSRPSN